MYAFYGNISGRLARTFLSTIKRWACWPLVQNDVTFPPMPTFSHAPLGQAKELNTANVPILKSVFYWNDGYLRNLEKSPGWWLPHKVHGIFSDPKEAPKSPC